MRLRASSSSKSAARAGSATSARERTQRARAGAATHAQLGRVIRRRRRCRRGGSRPTTLSSWPSRRGFSLPKLTVSIWISCAPSSTISFFTASARFWPSAMLYSRVPRSSVLPCSVIARAAVAPAGTSRAPRSIGLVLVLDHELVVVEVDAALATGCCSDPCARGDAARRRRAGDAGARRRAGGRRAARRRRRGGGRLVLDRRGVLRVGARTAGERRDARTLR